MPVIEKVGIRLIAHIQTHRLGQSCCNPEGMQGMVEGGQGGWGGEAAGGWYGAAFASGILYCRSLKTPLVNKITILCTLTASTNQTNYVQHACTYTWQAVRASVDKQSAYAC